MPIYPPPQRKHYENNSPRIVLCNFWGRLRRNYIITKKLTPRELFCVVSGCRDLCIFQKYLALKRAFQPGTKYVFKAFSGGTKVAPGTVPLRNLRGTSQQACFENPEDLRLFHVEVREIYATPEKIILRKFFCVIDYANLSHSPRKQFLRMFCVSNFFLGGGGGYMPLSFLTSKRVSAGSAGITGTTEVATTMGIWGAKPQVPQTMLGLPSLQKCVCEIFGEI